MKDIPKILLVYAVVLRTTYRLTEAVTSANPTPSQGLPVTQEDTPDDEVDGRNSTTEASTWRPESPDQVDVTGLSPDECLMQITQYFPEEHMFASCKCLNMFCPVDPDAEDRPETPDDVDVTGLFGEACVFKIMEYFPLAPDEYLLCRCLAFNCPNQTEEEKDAALRRMKQHYDSVYESHDDIYLGVFYVLVMAVGTVGNLLVLVTVFKVFKSPNVTNMFITSLAFADLFIVLICIPFRLSDYVGKQIWDLGLAVCKVMQYIYVFSFMTSVFTLVAMSLERYLVICYPMKAAFMSTPGRAKKIIAVVWITAAVLAISSGLIAGVNDLECELVDFPIYSKWKKYYYFYLLLVIFFGPTVLIAVAYGRTGFVLWKSISDAKQLTGEKSKEGEKATQESKARLQVIRMLFIIWILFTLTWGSYLLFHIFRIYRAEISLYSHGDALMITEQILNLLTMANSAVNPILYAFLSSQFRKGFIRCLSCIPIIKRKYLPPATTITGSTGIVSGTALSSISATVKS